jgi:sorbitol/mannitol transport system permease protein
VTTVIAPPAESRELTPPPRKKNGPPRRRMSREAWIRRTPLLPALIFCIVVTQIPFLLTLFYSFENYQLNYPDRPKNFPNVENYKRVFADPTFRSSAWHTVFMTAIPVLLAVVFGVGIATLLNRRVFGRPFLRTLIISPFLVMSSAAAYVWKYELLSSGVGVLNYFAKSVGIPQQDWASAHPQATIIAFLTWQWTPFMVLLALAGLQSQGDDVLEAARVDGANSWRIFRSITLPHLRQYIELGVLLGSIYIVQAFDPISIITVGGPGTDSTNLPYYIYRKGLTQPYNIGLASAMAVVVVVATILVATMALRVVSSLFSDEGMVGR